MILYAASTCTLIENLTCSHELIRKMQHKLLFSEFKASVESPLFLETIRGSSSGEYPHRAVAIGRIFERTIYDCRQAEREAKERAEREVREAREQAEREAGERADSEARERAEKEAEERAMIEARERAEREAREKEAKERAEKEAGERADREAKERAEKSAKKNVGRGTREKAEQVVSEFRDLEVMSAQAVKTSQGDAVTQSQPHTGASLKPVTEPFIGAWFRSVTLPDEPSQTPSSSSAFAPPKRR